MSDEAWPMVHLEDVASELTVGHVGTMASEYVERGIPFLRSQNVEPHRINTEDIKFISKEFHARLRKSALSPGDVVIVRTGKPGACAVIPKSLPESNCSDLVIVRCGPRLDANFLAYFVNSVATHHVNAHLVGAVQQHFNVGSARRLVMHLPPLAEQHAIAQILGTLDDKIELNRRMNETLEAMARALFKSWFVDFDPVRAKAEGRDPGLPRPIADLFPDSFENSELGEIPKGWRVERLSDLMTFEGGSQPPASEFISEPREGYVRLVQIRDFYTNSHMTFVPDTSRLRKFTVDDIMIARYGSSGNSEKMNDSLARVCRGLAGAYNVALVKVVPLRACREFLFYFLQSTIFQSTMKGMGARSVQSGFRKEDLQTIQLVTAPQNAHAQFEMFADSIWRSTFAADATSSTIAALRDALLPKLISGEIRVKDAERLASDVV